LTSGELRPKLAEQALGDGAFALDCGFLLHVYPGPFISGSKLVTKVLTEGLPSYGRQEPGRPKKELSEGNKRHTLWSV